MPWVTGTADAHAASSHSSPLAVPMDFQLADQLVRLRALTVVDAPAVYRAVEDPDIRWFNHFAEPGSIDQTRVWIDKQPTLRRRGISLDLGILPVGGMVIVGCVGVSRFSPGGDRAQIGLWVGPRSRGRGFAAAALGLISAWALGPPLQLARIELPLDADNRAGRATALRTGYRFEGVLRSRRYAKGHRRDIAMFSMLADDAIAQGLLPAQQALDG
jgi:RimJ/RimL family protein N-acetyltransferase